MSTTSAPMNITDRLNGNNLFRYSQMILKTCKFQVNNIERLQSAIHSERSVIFTGWHGITMMTVPLIQSHHPDVSDLVVLMPDDWRGMALQMWAEKMGATPHPMNLTGDNTMGMARQMVKLTRRVMGGKSLYINPDGPDGPAYVIKPGIAYIAKKVDALIVPIGAYCRHGYIAPRWDRYVMPYPYSRMAFHIGEPIDGLPDDDTAATKLITDTINRVTLQAAADYYEQAE